MSIKDAESAIAAFKELGGVLGLLQKPRATNLEAEVEDLIEQRRAARSEKNFALADEIRDKLKSLGIIIEDTPTGVKWHKM